MLKDQPPNSWDPVRRRLAQHEPDWAPEALWEAIESELPTRRRRRAAWLWFLLACTIVGLQRDTALSPILSYFPIMGQANHRALPTVERAQPIPKLPTIASPIASSPQKQSIVSLRPPVLSERSEAKPSLPLRQPEEPVIDAPENSRRTIAAVPTLPMTPLLSEIAIQLLDTPLVATFDTSSPAIEAPLATIFVRADIGIGAIRRTLESAEPDLVELVRARQATETVLEAIDWQATVGWRFRPRWSMRAGLGFQQLNERFDYFSRSLDTLSIPTDTAFYYLDGLGARQYVAGQAAAIQTTERQIRHYNRHRIWRLPFELGYRQPLGNWAIQLSLGGSLQLSHRYAGLQLLQHNQEVVPAEIAYQTSTHWAWLATVGLQRTITKRQRLHLRATFQDFGGGLSNPATPAVEQRYQQFGLQVGWSLDLGK